MEIEDLTKMSFEWEKKMKSGEIYFPSDPIVIDAMKEDICEDH